MNVVPLAYDRFGSNDDEAILLIPGLGTQRIRWTDAFCHGLVSRGFQVIRFDNRDSGESTHLAELPAPNLQAFITQARSGIPVKVPYTLREMAADAIALLDALHLDRVHVAGRSMGGMIAQIVASEFPQRTLSLTSIMSSTGNPSLPSAAPDVMELMMRQAPSPYEDEAGYLAHGLAFARRISSPAYEFDETAYRSLLLEEVRRRYDPQGFARQIAALAFTGDLRPQLAKITAPTLVIHGADDPLVLPACGVDTAASIPGAELMLIEGMGHDLPVALYERVIEAIAKTARRGSTAITQ
ncbi:alpha/beta fold hydrolase [Silvibacterium acidisoli]|uniref:alpha/beta fold hydrolase n=1 Tax=Acidobacteriaceae bacterium ZG23-2 TaxID=2883246 RepID=UPI00406CCE8B